MMLDPFRSIRTNPFPCYVEGTGDDLRVVRHGELAAVFHEVLVQRDDSFLHDRRHVMVELVTVSSFRVRRSARHCELGGRQELLVQ